MHVMMSFPSFGVGLVCYQFRCAKLAIKKASKNSFEVALAVAYAISVVSMAYMIVFLCGVLMRSSKMGQGKMVHMSSEYMRYIASIHAKQNTKNNHNPDWAIA